MKILLIEDSLRLQHSLKEGLSHEGFAVDITGNGLEGLEFIEVYEYDVIILDLMLPGMDGLSLLKKIRQDGNRSQVLILSAKDQIQDRVRGLDLGADDYLIKPFAFEELLARLRTLIRRKFDQKSPRLNIGPLTLNLSSLRVTREGKQILLSPKEFALLEYLSVRQGSVISREKLIEHLYGGDRDVGSNVIDVMVCHVRKKIELPGEKLIKTVRGYGYLVE